MYCCSWGGSSSIHAEAERRPTLPRQLCATLLCAQAYRKSGFSTSFAHKLAAHTQQRHTDKNHPPPPLVVYVGFSSTVDVTYSFSDDLGHGIHAACNAAGMQVPTNASVDADEQALGRRAKVAGTKLIGLHKPDWPAPAGLSTAGCEPPPDLGALFLLTFCALSFGTPAPTSFDTNASPSSSHLELACCHALEISARALDHF